MRTAIGLQHVLIECPAGSEDLMRPFSARRVVLAEIPEPSRPAAQGWLSP